MGSLENKIIERVHNMRAASRKRPQEHDASSETSKSRKQKQILVNRYLPLKDLDDDEITISLPLKDLDDDEITISRNLSALRKELNMEKPMSLSNQVFPARREIILEEIEATASSLIERFPKLKLSHVVS